MKCLILAGGRGERLWPLSRKNYPKQFIEIQKNHSVFQETVARNIPYCDEFIIVTSYEYRYIIADQMQVFQGTPYRCVFEEIPRKTTAAIELACLELQPSEYVFVVAADHLIDTQWESADGLLGYKDAILQAKSYAKDGAIALFAMEEQTADSRFGYMKEIRSDGSVGMFLEKPDAERICAMEAAGDFYRNLGMMLFQNGTLQKELRTFAPEVVRQCYQAYSQRRILGSDVFYPEQVQSGITAVAIEKSLMERTNHLRAVRIGFRWNDIGALEDLGKTDIQPEGVTVNHNCTNSVVVNKSSRQAVVANGLEDVLVVNTPDAVYVGKYGASTNLKEIIHTNEELRPYTEKGTQFYRSWGTYERYIEEPDYRIQKLSLLAGKTIYRHKHLHRSESWTVIRGKVLVSIDGTQKICNTGDNITAPAGRDHQISNVGQSPAVLLEIAIGEILHGQDMVSNPVADIAEAQLGYGIEQMVKLMPAFKDSLWGGTKLRDIYHKKCDYEVISESWELSAHPDGQSIVASGRHKGKSFGHYLQTVGKEVLGWKCDPLQSFPLLVKFIDARENLSIQVHPDDDYALERENQYGKNEMWYVIDAEPGAGLYVGFDRDVSAEEVVRRVKDNSLMEILNFYPTKPGDVFYIPAGTVHAIGGGNLICEIQQSSNCTYRLYDYDRRDKFGNPRQLHLEKALEVLDFKQYKPVPTEKASEGTGTVLSRCKYFESVLHEISGTERITLHADRFSSVICLKGEGELSVGKTTMPICAGESVFLPAAENVLTVAGELSLVMSYI